MVHLVCPVLGYLENPVSPFLDLERMIWHEVSLDPGERGGGIRLPDLIFFVFCCLVAWPRAFLAWMGRMSQCFWPQKPSIISLLLYIKNKIRYAQMHMPVLTC